MSALIQANELLPLLNERTLLVLDCRTDLSNRDNSLKLYQQGHIPGAIHADAEEDLSGEIIPGKTGRHPLPSAEKWQQVLRRWGANKDTRFILYDQNNSMFAVRAWWMLQWAGLTNVQILNGGLTAYLNAGGELATDTPMPSPSELTIQVRDELHVDAHYVSNRPANSLLLDARALPRYEGKTEPLDTKAGHIPGARNADFSKNLSDNHHFLPADQLQQRFAELVGREVICYCGSGVTACHNIFAACEAGLPMPKLYAGSWSEWITDDNRPIASGCEGEPL